MLGNLISLALFLFGFFAIHRWAPRNDWRTGRPIQLRKFLFIGLGAVVLIWFLGLVGLFGRIAVDPVKPF